MKNEFNRTVTYVVVAGLSVGLAVWLSPPGEITPKELIDLKVGTEFFKDFTNPNDATSINVVSYDETSATSRRFAVSFENGKWTIPSHHNYPADGQDRLAKTASSVRGIKREELASMSKQHHEQLGVIDPMDKDRAELKGRGQRLTLRKGEDALVDLIIGKPLKDRPGFYYVRRPDEDATFVAKLDINLSTKFADWIETDLLKLNRDDLKQIVIDNYSIDKTQGVLVPGEISRLDRDKTADPWTLEGLDGDQEEVDVAKVNGMLGALDDLKIVGVRPKPKGFTPDLSIDPEFVKKQSDLTILARDLQSAGFALTMDKKTKQLRLYSDQGDLTAATGKGAVYLLRFGDVFIGDETEIEIGGTSNKDEAPQSGDEAEGSGQSKDKDKDSSTKQSSRYLFVTVSFDESFLGPRPQKPQPPEGLAAADDQAADKNPRNAEGAAPQDQPEAPATPEKKPDDNPNPGQTSEQPQGAGQAEDRCLPGLTDDAADQPEAKPEASADEQPKQPATEAPAGDQKPETPAEPDQPAVPTTEPEQKPADKPEPKKSAEQLKKEYEQELRKYEADLKAFEDKVAAGKKQVDELNARFSNWYYVISADYFNKLHLTRKELIQPKAKPGEPGGPPTGQQEPEFPPNN